MKIEKVSNNRIKVTVTNDDMERWGVSFESFAGDSPEAQELFWTLIKRAEFETGFEVENSRLVIEALPHKNDGIVLFVTRVDDGAETERLRKIGRPRYKVKKMPQRDDEEVLIYMFSDFDDLCAMAQQWMHAGERSSLYIYEGKYYVAVKFDKFFANSSDAKTKLSEFGTKVSSVRTGEAFLAEYGKLICDDQAILTMARHFKA